MDNTHYYDLTYFALVKVFISSEIQVQASTQTGVLTVYKSFAVTTTEKMYIPLENLSFPFQKRRGPSFEQTLIP